MTKTIVTKISFILTIAAILIACKGDVRNSEGKEHTVSTEVEKDRTDIEEIPTTSTNVETGESHSKKLKLEVGKEPIIAEETTKESKVVERTANPVDQKKSAPVKRDEDNKTTIKTTTIMSEVDETPIDEVEIISVGNRSVEKEPVLKEPKQAELVIPIGGQKEKDIVISPHKDFDYLLSKYVSDKGVVNYKGLKNELPRLDTYLDYLSTVDATVLTKEAGLAYWINAYNAFTLKLIIDNYPVGSITDLYGGKPWDVKWINIDGGKLSLNAIENEIIRPTYREPRIHFAVNCAAKSCPPLLNKAYTAENLYTLLEAQTRKFINSSHNMITAKSANVSKIFEWYAEDFGDLKKFLTKYTEVELDADASITYREYDWGLNE